MQFGKELEGERISQLLTERPGMNTKKSMVYEFSWGRVVIQDSPSFGYAPFYDNNTLFCCAGRPYFLGFGPEDSGDEAIMRLIAKKWVSSSIHDLSLSLSGMFAIARIDDHSIQILTDQMGCRPVYTGTTRNHHLASIGTYIDAVAFLAGRGCDFDLLSLGELLVWNYITFPHTSFKGVQEIEPSSLYTFDCSHEGAPTLENTETTWLPREPKVSLSTEEQTANLEQALRQAAVDICRGCNRVAVTLSGGFDSRAVLSVIPPECELSAITYVSRENRETRLAKQVASSQGVRWIAAYRDAEYYATLPDRECRLIGCELRSSGHGFVILDRGLDEQFDLIVGGFLSDTYLKDHFMPGPLKASLSQPEEMSESIEALDNSCSVPDDSHILHKDILDGIINRRESRLNRVREIRPHSAEEWVRFWPTSRQDDAANALVNSRLFSADELFMHRGVINVAASLSPSDRFQGKVCFAAFSNLYGLLSNIDISSTGRAAKHGPTVITPPKKRMRIPGVGRMRRLIRRRSIRDPWNDVEGSWPNSKILQQQSATWASLRKANCKSPTMDILCSILDTESILPRGQYCLTCAARTNRMFVYVAMHLNHVMQLTHEIACNGMFSTVSADGS